MGPKPQSQSNQFRPPLPDTNPQVRKESKVTEKRKRLIPTKKYKVNVVARPDPGNMTTQLPITADTLLFPSSTPISLRLILGQVTFVVYLTLDLGCPLIETN